MNVIGDAPVGALDADLRGACLQALALSRDACRAFALGKTWHDSARAFIANVRRAAAANAAVARLREASA